MSCIVPLFLAGFCSFPPPSSRTIIDTGRFGPVSIELHTQIVSRIDGAFQQPEIRHAFLQWHLGNDNLKMASIAVESEPPMELKPTIRLESTKLAYAKAGSSSDSHVDPGLVIRKTKAGTSTEPNSGAVKEKSKERRKNILAMFRTRSKAPKGVDVNKSGYRAVKVAALRHGVDVNFALAVAKQESRGNCKARSHANAKGVMQVIPGTARKYGVRRSNRLYNCKVGADIGVRELKSCLKKANGNKPKALACYNAGPGWITSRKYRGKRLPSETRNYIKKITGKTYARLR